MSENAETVHGAPLSLKFGVIWIFKERRNSGGEVCSFSLVCKTAIMLTGVAMVTLARREGMMKRTWAVFL